MKQENDEYEFYLTDFVTITGVRDGTPEVRRAYQTIKDLVTEDDSLENKVTTISNAIRNDVNTFVFISPFDVLSTIVGGDPEIILQEEDRVKYLSELMRAFDEEHIQ